jgi:hypothetical protein
MGFNDIHIVTMQNYSGSLHQTNAIYYIDDAIMAGIPLVDAGSSTNDGTAYITFKLQDLNNSAHVAALSDYEAEYTFDTTGVFRLLSSSSVTISATEIGYLNGVTSNIQTQLDLKLESSDLTGYATEAYADTAASNAAAALVDTAPAALDTLNELAAALGDDANFATTVTTALGNKQDKVSGVSDTEIGYLDGVTSAIQTQISGKANTSHTHAISDVTNLQTSLDAKAPLADPTFTGVVSGNASATSTAANGAKALGFKGIPASSAPSSGAYTLVAADSGEMVYTTTTRTVTIPSNASVPFEIGTSIVFISGAGATTTIAITSDTMLLAGAGTTGSRTLAAHGMATAVKVAATTWYISGNGLT